MRSHIDSTSPRPSTPPNAFSPAFLAHHQSAGEPPTAAEADLAGPWKTEPVPGHPGAVAVLRVWESQEKGDVPELIFLNQETAEMCAAILPVVQRELFYHLHDTAVPEGPEPGGYPASAMYGDQGPQVMAWSRLYKPRIFEALHLIEGVVRAPQILAAVARCAGGGALAQVGRCLAEQQPE